MSAETAKRKAYDTDLTDEPWALIAPLFPLEVGAVQDEAHGATAKDLGGRRLRGTTDHSGQLITWVRDNDGWDLEIKKRPEEKGFHLIKHRWIVERTFGWLGRYRFLAKDYAATIASSEAEIHLAMTHLMLNRLTHQVPENEHRFASAA